MNKIKLLLLSILVPLVPALASSAPKVSTASWYGPGFEGKTMANGNKFKAANCTCASWFFPLGTIVRVTNVTNGRYILVQVTDRGPARHLVADGRIIDLSAGAFSKIADLSVGLVTVQVGVVATIRRIQ